MSKKVILMIFDGWGFAAKPEVSSIDLAHTYFDFSCIKYAHFKNLGFADVRIHMHTDDRVTGTKSSHGFVKQLQKQFGKTTGNMLLK